MERRLGRTLAMVRALPETGCVVVVHDKPLAIYVRQMISDVRGADVAKATTVVVCRHRGDAEANLTGRRVPVIIDHAFRDHVSEHVANRVVSIAMGCLYAALMAGVQVETVNEMRAMADMQPL